MAAGWVREDGKAGAHLLHLYDVIALVTLITGGVLWASTIPMWKRCFARANTAVQSFIMISVADALTLINHIIMNIYALTLSEIPDNRLCKVSAFVAMTAAYGMAYAYLGASFLTLILILGYKETKVFRTSVYTTVVFGWLAGIGFSCAYAVSGQFGPYRNLYCMVPQERYTSWGLILGFVFVGGQIAAAMSFNIAGYLEKRRIQREAGLHTDAQSFYRISAFGLLERFTNTLLAIFLISQAAVFIVEIMIWAGTPVPLGFDVFAAAMYKTHPLWDSIVIRALLKRVDYRVTYATHSRLPEAQRCLYLPCLGRIGPRVHAQPRSPAGGASRPVGYKSPLEVESPQQEPLSPGVSFRLLGNQEEVIESLIQASQTGPGSRMLLPGTLSQQAVHDGGSAAVGPSGHAPSSTVRSEDRRSRSNPNSPNFDSGVEDGPPA